MKWRSCVCNDCNFVFSGGVQPGPKYNCPSCNSDSISDTDTEITTQLFPELPSDMQDLYESFFDFFCADVMKFLQSIDSSIVELCRIVTGARGGGVSSEVTPMSDIDMALVVNHLYPRIDSEERAVFRMTRSYAVVSANRKARIRGMFPDCLIFGTESNQLVEMPKNLPKHPDRKLGWWYNHYPSPIYIRDKEHLHELFPDVPGCSW